METDKIYHIGWQRFSWDNRPALIDDHDFGLYQVYGDHCVYGSDVLLYIGLAQCQKFGLRLGDAQHSDLIYNHYSRFTSLFLGRFLKWPESISYEEWGNAIANSERLLINVHTPAYNSQNVKEVQNWDSHIIIYNWGDYGSLLPVVTSRRFSSVYWDDTMYKEEFFTEK